MQDNKSECEGCFTAKVFWKKGWQEQCFRCNHQHPLTPDRYKGRNWYKSDKRYKKELKPTPNN